MNIIRQINSDIMAISLDGPSSLYVKLKLNVFSDHSHSHGWGLGWYPNDKHAAMVIKDPSAREVQVVADSVTDWSSFRSTVFFCKVRGAADGYGQTETQPFSRNYAGQDWMFLHGGDLDRDRVAKLSDTQSVFLEPLGHTDSELVFCYLLSKILETGSRRLYDLDPYVLLSWLQELDDLGGANIYLSDGVTTIAFNGSNSAKQISYARFQPPLNKETLESDFANISLEDPRDSYRTMLVFSTGAFSRGDWVQMKPGQLLIARRGAIVWSSSPENNFASNAYAALPEPAQQKETVTVATQAEQAQTQVHGDSVVKNIRSMTQTEDGQELAYRVYDVSHTTNYEYSEPVEHSKHFFRLQPKDDVIQEVMASELSISVPCEKIQFEDVFGNQAVHCTIDVPYTKLTVEIKSRVKIFGRPIDDHGLSRRQTSIPLIWMPWQRQMMMSYLLPVELPEDQLIELTEYAMGFVVRNNYNLLKTIEDLNVSIYRDYQYIPGSTSLETTPFDVYTNRRGVCQDFANLFICVARLLGIPARYRMGYIYTGANYENKLQSEASHAWAEIYLPYVGWRGFDPTNGCAASQDHIRVACGRNYKDATPTSGTIYKGGGRETLSVDVKVTELQE